MTKLGSGLAVLGLFALAVAQQKIVFEDKGGSMQVTGFTSWSTKRLTNNRFSFVGIGKPVVASWEVQGMTVRADRVEGVVERTTSAGFALSSGTMVGAVRANVVRPSSSGKGNQTFDVAAQKVAILTGGSQLDLSGGVRLQGSDVGAGQSYDLSGSTAKVLVATGPGKAPLDAIKHMDMAGPVSFKFSRNAANGLEMKGTANRLIFDGVARTLELIGNVKLQGADPQFGAESASDRAIIRLDAQRNPTEVELTGNPVESTVKQNPRFAP